MLPGMARSTHRSLTDVVDPVVVIAFGGWSDAGNAVSDALDHLRDQSDATLAWDMGDEYYDLQATRPVISGTGTDREILWPSTMISVGRLVDATGKDLDLVLVQGPEPNLRWEMFAGQLVSALRSTHPRLVLVLGALLSDHPHTLPVPISRSSSNPDVRSRFGADEHTYEGPTGITGVVTHACERIGLPTMSLWATLPHYVAHTPSPKATLAVLQHVETLLDANLDLGELARQARRWEMDVSEFVESDDELNEYVTSLIEDHGDDPTDGSGDAIAAEFERYLRRRGD